MVKLIGNFGDLIVFVTGTLDIEISVGEGLDLLFEFRERFEAPYHPEVEQNDQDKDDRKDYDPFERKPRFVLVLQKELKAVIVDQDHALEFVGVGGVVLELPLLLEVVFDLDLFSFVLDE